MLKDRHTHSHLRSASDHVNIFFIPTFWEIEKMELAWFFCPPKKYRLSLCSNLSTSQCYFAGILVNNNAVLFNLASMNPQLSSTTSHYHPLYFGLPASDCSGALNIMFVMSAGAGAITSAPCQVRGPVIDFCVSMLSVSPALIASRSRAACTIA